MPATTVAFRDWILSRKIEGGTTEQVDDDHIVLHTASAEAHINFFTVAEDEPRVVEFLIRRKGGEGDDAFHLHFELTDEERAQELFDEMLDVLLEQGRHATQQVLLVCTTGLTTSLFAEKMNETATSLSLDYSFEAMPLEDALESRDAFTAVMLAPQVGFQRRQVAEAFPDIPVFEIPAKIYGAYDAGAAIRLLLDALDATTPDATNLRMVRDIENERTLLIVYVNLHRDRTTIRYRLYQRGRITLQGRVAKRTVDFRDVDELLNTLKLRGLNYADVDAVGVVVPGIVDGSLATFPPTSDHTFDFGGELQARYGVRIYAENDANAATVGCYVTQAAYENVSLVIQHAGHLAGSAGTIEDGHLVKGRRGFAGELGPVQRIYYRGMDVEEMRWSPEAVRQSIAAHIAAASCLVAPDVFYVAVELVPDMEALREEVARILPEGFVPDLMAVNDLREHIFVGMLALTLSHLEAAEQAAVTAAKAQG